MVSPAEILERSYRLVEKQLKRPFVEDKEILNKVIFISRNIQNRAGVRLLLANLLAVIYNAKLDVRKPYTEIGAKDSFSGRHFDEAYISTFISKHSLPCNPTTAFLTPALRNRNIILTPRVNLVGRPPEIYQRVLELFDLVHTKKIEPDKLMLEVIRQLILFRDESQKRIKSLLANLKNIGSMPLSSEDIISLIRQHLDCKNSSRLPVIIVAAAYRTAGRYFKEKIIPLESHNAADKQTGCLGDIQVTFESDNKILTSYEMKMKRVTLEDINIALNKVAKNKYKIDNYIFITTNEIDSEVQDYCKSLYEQTGGIEFVVLDCLSFLRHFLHLFHRFRLQYLEEYQKIVLGQPDSAINKPLKEAFLALRQAAESSYE